METNTYLSGQAGSNYVPTSDERTFAILSHVLTLVFPILAPLIIYLIKKDESKYVSHHAKESLNFQITIMLVVIGLCISIIGILFVWAVGIVALVFVIIATIRAADNNLYKYPFSLRLIK